MLEFKADGFLHSLSIFEPSEVASKELWESMLPLEALEPEKKLEEPKTPAFTSYKYLLLSFYRW